MPSLDDNIIQKIIDLERKAQDVVNEARAERHSREETIRRDIDAYKEKIAGENSGKIRAYSDEARREAEEGVARLEESARRKIVRMREYADGHKDEWIDRLYAKITGGEI
jgi:hypothetical protein